MVNKIERRDNDIEIMRENYLEYYYDDEQYNLDDESLQALGLNMYVRKQNIRTSLYDSFCRSSYDKNIVMHPQQVECLNYLFKGENLLISAPTSFGKTFVALEYISRIRCNLSTSAVMDMLEVKYNEIMNNKKIDNVSKDLLKILLDK